MKKIGIFILGMSIAMVLYFLFVGVYTLDDWIAIVCAVVGVNIADWIYERFFAYRYRWKCPECSLVIRMSAPAPFYQMKFMHATTMHHSFPKVMDS